VNTIQNLLVDSLWVLGLAGVLATVSYVSWYRGVHSRSWRYVFSLPQMLIPLTVSLELFSIGLAAHGLIVQPPAPWWETAAWSILAFLFAVQTVLYGLAGLRHGWDTPIEERDEDDKAQSK